MSEIKDRNPLAEPPNEPDKKTTDGNDTKSFESTVEDVRKHFSDRTEESAWGNASRPDFVPPTSDVQHAGKFFREVLFTDDIHELLQTDESGGQYAIKAMCQKDRLMDDGPSSAWRYLIALRDRLGYRRQKHEYDIEDLGDTWERFRKGKGREPKDEQEFVDFTVQDKIDHMDKWSYEWLGGDREKMQKYISRALKRLRPERIAGQFRKNYTTAQNWFNEALPDCIPEAVFIIEEGQAGRPQPRSDAIAFLKGDVQIYEVQKKVELAIKMPPSTSGMGIFFGNDPDAYKYTIRDLVRTFDKKKLENILRQLKIFNQRAIELVEKENKTIDFVGEGNMGVTEDGTLRILDVDLTTLKGIQRRDVLEALRTGYFGKIVQELEKIVHEEKR